MVSEGDLRVGNGKTEGIMVIIVEVEISLLVWDD